MSIDRTDGRKHFSWFESLHHILVSQECPFKWYKKLHVQVSGIKHCTLRHAGVFYRIFTDSGKNSARSQSGFLTSLAAFVSIKYQGIKYDAIKLNKLSVGTARQVYTILHADRFSNNTNKKHELQHKLTMG